MDSLVGVENELEKKVHHLLVLYASLKKEQEVSRQRIMALEEELTATKKKYAECRLELENVKCAKATTVSEAEKRKMYNRMLKIEREVEKCMMLLNE